MSETGSGGPWELPDSWLWSTVGDITEPVSKVSPRDRPDTPFTYLDISSIDNTSHSIAEPKTYYGAEAPSRARQVVKAGDVLFSTVRTYLKNIAPVPHVHDGQVASTGFSVLRAGPYVLPGYVLYYSLTDQFVDALTKLQRGTSYPAVRDTDVRARPFPVAPLPEQHRIVEVIETQSTRVDAAVAALERAQANLKRYRASVLKAACEGRLVPTEAELARAEGRDYEPADQLLQRILTERRAKWGQEHPGRKYKEPAPPDTADLPELPEGWVWASTLQLSTKVTDGVHKTPKYVEEGVPFLSVSNLSRSGSLTFSPCKYITAEEHEELYRRCNPQMGDVLLSKVGTIGLTTSIKTDKVFSLFVNTALIKPVRRLASSDYIAVALRFGFMSKAYDQYIGGSTQRFIGTTKIGRLPIPLPPQEEQHRITDEVDRRLSLLDALQRQVETGLARAARLRQAILRRAFEGRLAEQDPNDEPASVLLERIKAQRKGA
jgi:type I restriction enzyme S subunit